MDLREDFEGKRVHFVFAIYDKRARCLDASALAPNTHFWEKLNQTPIHPPCPNFPNA